MDKICIFCGQETEQKSNEHVIPMWLIELTGNPKRIGEFGYKDFISPQSGKKHFSFDSFKFPSCKACNFRYSELEALAKPVVQKIVDADSLSAPEFNTLLDWFDKIRIGLWLGFRYLHKDPGGVTPNFYIDSRLRVSDRMLVIFKGDGNKSGLNFVGCDQPSSIYTPSCFCLRINDYCFLNISCFELISRRIGFPYMGTCFFQKNGHIQGEFIEGRNRIMNPIIRKRISIKGTELYQPIFSNEVNNPDTSRFFNTEYVRDYSMLWEEGIGKIFITSDSGLREYPMSGSKMWLPERTYVFKRLLYEMQILVFEWQNYIEDIMPSLDMLSKEEKQKMKRQIRMNKRYNEQMIMVLREKAEKSDLPPLINDSAI